MGPAPSGAGGDRARAAHAQPLSRSGQGDAPPAPRRAPRDDPCARRRRQRLVRAPACCGRRPARARGRDRLRLAVVLDVPAPGSAERSPGDRGSARRGGAPRPRGHGARGDRRHPHRARVQPEQPDRHRALERGDRRVRVRAPAARLRDPRRGLRGVLHAPGPGRVASHGGAAPQRGPAADLLEGLRAVRPAGGVRARLGGLPGGRRPRAAAVLCERAGAGGRGGGPRAPGRGGAPRGAGRHRAPARRGGV